MKNPLIEQYKNGTMTLDDTISALDKSNFTDEEIKKGGIVYTPEYICDYIVASLKPNLDESIMEPSVGHGIFLFSLLSYIENTFGASEVKKYYLKNFTGVDIERNNITELGELVVVWFGKRNIDISHKEASSRLINADTLRLNSHFDIIFGNPPYIRIQNIEEDSYRDFLRSGYETCSKGNIDIYYAFIEHAHTHSDRCSFIVPNSYIKNASAKILRKSISDDLYSIINFEDIKIFEGVGTYTSIFVIDKKSSGNDILTRYGIDGYYSPESLDSLKFESIDGSVFVDNVVSGGVTFDITEVYGSIATLRDKIFLLKDGKTVCGSKVDSVDTVAYLKCTKLKSVEDVRNNSLRMITPYGSNGKLKQVCDIGIDTFSYLNSKKIELSMRDKGKQDKYEKWYSYGRTQGLNDKSLTKHDNSIYSLIIIPGMFSSENRFFSFKYEDIGENYYLTSGFIIKVLDKDASGIINYLNSSKFIDLCNEHGTVRPGKSGKYYSISKTVMLGILT